MKTQLSIYIILISTVLLAGWEKTVYSIKPANYQLPGTTEKLKLDGSFELYVRAVQTGNITVTGNHKQRELSLFKKGVTKGGTPVNAPKIIEIEYLFLSSNTAVYISTVADRYETRYSSTKFMGIETPNAADFRVFLIGRADKTDPDKYIFYDKKGKQTDTWTVQKNGVNVRLLLIEQKHFNQYEDSFILSDALYNELIFTRQDNWEIKYLDTVHNTQEKMKESVIYYNTGGKTYTLLLPFTDHCLTFPNDHIIYSPERKAYVKP